MAVRRRSVAAVLVGLLLAFVPVSTTMGPAAAAPRFSDVPASHLFFPHISWMATEQITSGTDDGRFLPGSGMTRGQFAVFMYKAAGEPAYTPPPQPRFADVPVSHGFYKHISWLASEGIVQGYPGGGFGPDDEVTRGQLAVILFNDENPTYAPPSTSPFTDLRPQHMFFRHITWLHREGLVNGYDDGTFRQATSLTRGQAAVIFHNWLEGPLSTERAAAFRAAQGWLDLFALSRAGLVEMLQFDDHAAADAEWAADELAVNWKAQAARSVREYLAFQDPPRTKAEMVEQLVEEEGFTPEQAEYGVTAAGL